MYVYGMKLTEPKSQYHTDAHYMQKKLQSVWDLPDYNPRVRIGVLKCSN